MFLQSLKPGSTSSYRIASAVIFDKFQGTTLLSDLTGMTEWVVEWHSLQLTPLWLSVD